jgi:hypothetical protein
MSYRTKTFLFTTNDPTIFIVSEAKYAAVARRKANKTLLDRPGVKIVGRQEISGVRSLNLE